MKFIFFVVALALCGTAFCEIKKCKFHLDMPSIKYVFDGYAYADVKTDATSLFELKDAIIAPFNGTIVDEKGAKHFTEGKVVIDDPPISHIDKIKVSGQFQNPTVGFSGLFKVKIWDVMKPKVPIKGHLKFTNGKEGDAAGIIEKFVMLDSEQLPLTSIYLSQ
eukprot:TRINITY_DN105978_c0_g1_i1.p2 TRINITY_DN105978_c0_g1~~TRINITY_DN105978_c0_g1_i1.p2  ORF type:complete len:163 (+),score=29.90 TRINITY_DN105978_c0_g1_i1:137-625(+)